MDQRDAPKINLSKKEIKLLQQSWATVMQRAEANGVEMLINFFTKYPDAQKLFNGFHNVPLASLDQNPAFREHAHNILSSFNNAIEHLNVIDVVVESLNQIGSDHKDKHVTESQFNDMKVDMIEMIKRQAELTPSGEALWDKMFGIAYEMIFETMEE